MTRLFLVRHGETALSAAQRFSGSTGVDLSDEGRRQVQCLADRLAGVPFQSIYTSPLSRTRETAEILAARVGGAVRVRDGLREIDHGRWEGLTEGEVKARYPSEYEAWLADPFSFAPEEGESGLGVLARALPVVREIVLGNPTGSVLVVSHKATLRLLLASLLGIDPRGYRARLEQAPGCLNVLDFAGPAQARLVLFNDVSHYMPLRRAPI